MVTQKHQKRSFSNFLNLNFRIIEHYINETIKRFESNPSENTYEEGILQKLVKTDKKAAISIVYDMIIAGVDTTGNMAVYVLYLLAKNPDKQQLLREEILKIMPEKKSKLTSENMTNLPYMRAVLKETHRMMPISMGAHRKLMTPTVLSGYEVPANTHVVMVPHTELTNPKHFPQPEKFIPERWLRENKDSSCPNAKTAHPYAFLPFGFGPRICKYSSKRKKFWILFFA